MVTNKEIAPLKEPEDLANLLWVYPQEAMDWCQSIVKEFNIHPAIAQVLASRGFTSFEAIYHYLYAKLPNLHDPDKLDGMQPALQRIRRALETKESILIYGDNDVDGMTGAALLVEFFSLIGNRPHYFIPNRSEINTPILTDALDDLQEKGCTLVITVDCGITAFAEIEELTKKKIDVIVSDHHEPTDKIPLCIGTLNPKLANSRYPNRDLTGVGVAFKLAHAMTNFLVAEGKISASQIDLKRFLDLVALGTVADMGALTDENRILVRYGLRQFAKTKRIGMLKLLEVCETKPSDVTTNDVVSKLSPRFNSSGRIAEDPKKGVDLLLTQDAQTARALATELDENNTQRQLLERQDMEIIEQEMHKNPTLLEQKAIIIHSDQLHPGIIPIIATRISKQYHRPTLIIALKEGIGKGSMRTIPEFPLLSFLRKHPGLMLNFGGHDYAAGLTIEEKCIPTLKAKLIAEANNMLKSEDTTPKLDLDAYLSFKDLTFDFLESLHLLEPYGMANSPPIFYTDVKQTWAPKVIGKTHLKLYLEQDGRMLEGIGFGLAHCKKQLSKKNIMLRIAFTPHVNVFLNKSSIQLLVKGFKLQERGRAP